MTDNITLRRAEAERGRTALRLARKFVGPTLSDELSIFLAALDAALAEPDAKREPATDEQIIASWPTELPYLLTPHAFYKGFRAAERFHGIRKEGA
jgi:hypothetical protein